MTKLTRRRFTSLAGASLAAAATPLFAPAVLGQARPRVVVVGGGPGGGTVARYVARDAAGAVDVTLIEPQREFTTCFFSNLYVGGFRSFDVDHPRLPERCPRRRAGRARMGELDQSRTEDGGARRRRRACPTTGW